MGLTKQYLAYRPAGTLNIVASGRPNINFLVHNKIEGRYCVVGAAENAIIWDLRLGEKIKEFYRQKQEVTALRVSSDRTSIALGYSDGVIEVFEIESESSIWSLAAHKSAVTVLRYDNLGIRIISGGMDTELVVTDVISRQGKYRLCGHNGPITDAHFLENIQNLKDENIVLTSSKDTQIKFWNLHTQNCFKTLVDNRTEIWALALSGHFLIAGSGENIMNVYKIKIRNETQSEGKMVENISLEDEDTMSPIIASNCGKIQRAGKGRTVSLTTDPTGRVLLCHGTNNLVEVFLVCSDAEVQRRLRKRLKKLSKKENNTTEENIAKDITLTDEIKRLSTVKMNHKIKSIDCVIGQNNELRILGNLANNSLELHSLDISNKSSESNLMKILHGHQSEVRNVCFSSDSLAIASGSGESLKIWNRNCLQCFRTIPTDYILCSCFVPGDRHILLGMKSGYLLVVDIGTGDILEEVSAHQNELWSICLMPNLKGCVTGSSDTTVKFWDFELIDSNEACNNSGSQKTLSLLHKNTLKLNETILCIKISPNNKFISTGLLDSTVKIFFFDSLKFYLSLYGHKLPVLCLDISYDSNLIITGSADRNIKIWGLDFGDCHHSLFAHDDSVMSVQFIPKTHMFFSCGKDGRIKQWDADSFEKITNLDGHIGEAYHLAVSPNGEFLVSCGSDRTLRIFERTDEPIVLQDIREQEREELEAKQLATGAENEVQTLPGLKMPSRKTVGAEKAAESIFECLEICSQFEVDPSIDHPLMKAYNVHSTSDLIIAVFQRIRAADLEEALLLLPFSEVCHLLERISKLTDVRQDQCELILKICIFLFRIHHKPISSNHTLLPLLSNLINKLERLGNHLRDTIGMNLYGFQVFQRDLEEKEQIELFKDATQSKKYRDKIKKRQLAKRLHIQLT